MRSITRCRGERSLVHQRKIGSSVDEDTGQGLSWKNEGRKSCMKPSFVSCGHGLLVYLVYLRWFEMKPKGFFLQAAMCHRARANVAIPKYSKGYTLLNFLVTKNSFWMLALYIRMKFEPKIVVGLLNTINFPNDWPTKKILDLHHSCEIEESCKYSTSQCSLNILHGWMGQGF